jgi:hypothetical protein
LDIDGVQSDGVKVRDLYDDHLKWCWRLASPGLVLLDEFDVRGTSPPPTLTIRQSKEQAN